MSNLGHRMRRAAGQSDPAGLTQKGYGYYTALENSNLVLSYANVLSGSAPAAGDLVCWIGMYWQTEPMHDLTGSGWVQSNDNPSSSWQISMLGKVVVSGDISSPPTWWTAGTSDFGGAAMWVAYSVSGSISALAASTIQGSYGGSSAPSSINVNSSGIGGAEIAVTLGLSTGNDNSLTHSWSGASQDFSFARNDSWGFGDDEDAMFAAAALLGGANVTMSKGDDGSSNGIAGGYIRVTF